MTNIVRDITRRSMPIALAASVEGPARPRRAVWAAYAACAWSFAFAALSFYWAAGGTAGVETLGHALKEAALASRPDPHLVPLLWATGAVKVLGALCALALVRPWGQALPRRLLLIPAWLAGAGMVAYGGIPLVVNGLMLAGLLVIPGSVDWTAIRWHVVLWDPWWLLGGVLFVVAARSDQRRSRPQPVEGA